MHNDHQQPYLVIWEATKCDGQGARHPLELDTTEARAMIDQAAGLRPDSFLITGTDPVARPDLVELIEYATRRGLRVTMSSNATARLASADLLELKQAGLQQISLGLDRVSHILTTTPGREGNCTMAVVRKAHEAGLAVQVHTTFTRLNFVQFDALVAQVDQIQPRRWNVFQDVPCVMEGIEPLTANEGAELSRKLARLAEQVPYEIKTAENRLSAVNRPSLRQNAPNGRFPMGMIQGGGFLFISHVGGLRPSSFHPITAGNIRICDLAELYRRLDLLQKQRVTSSTPISRRSTECLVEPASQPQAADAMELALA